MITTFHTFLFKIILSLKNIPEINTGKSSTLLSTLFSLSLFDLFLKKSWDLPIKHVFTLKFITEPFFLISSISSLPLELESSHISLKENGTLTIKPKIYKELLKTKTAQIVKEIHLMNKAHHFLSLWSLKKT